MDTAKREPESRHEADEPILLVSLGEATEQTQGHGPGSAEDKRRAYN